MNVNVNNQSNFKISIIISCYNAEKTLKRSIGSVINQTFGFENIELIIYDDASTDKTRQIITDYSQKFQNIIPIFNNINKGPGVGRNKGIKIASSELIMFLDSDDEYIKTICQTLFDEITQNGDIISCNHFYQDKLDYHKSINNINGGSKVNDRTIFKFNELIYFNDFVVWNKIYKKSFLIENEIEFPPIYNGEDEIFLRKIFLKEGILIHLDNYFGYIKHNEFDSITNTVSVNDLYVFLEMCEIIEKMYANNSIDLSRILQPRIYMIILSLYKTDILKTSNKNEIYSVLDKLEKFENKIQFNDSLGLLGDISNYFIKKRKFRVVIWYSHFLFYLQKNKLILKLFRMMPIAK